MAQRKPIGFCTDAVEKGDVETVRRMLLEHNFFSADMPHYIHSILADAAKNNDLVMVQELVRLGANINWSEDGHEDDASNALHRAAGAGAINVTRWLIAQGAKCNRWDGERLLCPSLAGAAREGHLEVVKLLVENGAAINATWMGRNPLSLAMDYGHEDVASYLRSQGAKTPDELAESDSANGLGESPFIAHLGTHLGTPEPLALREIVPTDLPIAIHVIRTEDEQILVTEGMSARPMTVPAGGEAFQLAELVLRLPSDWPSTLEAFANPNHYWPIEWLKRIARYPHDNDTWLGGPHTIIANGEPPEPFALNTKMSCLMLLANPSEFGRWTRPTDGAEVVFYDLFGLYTEERDLELREGLPELLNRFQDRFISKVLDPHRPNVAL